MTLKTECWTQTYSGTKFYPMNIYGSKINIYDIAHALSNVCRFAGHCSQFYSVAQHSVIVSKVVSKENARWGLLHDAAEAYIGDIARPIKHIKGMTGYRKLEREILKVVADRFGLEPKIPNEVKEYDDLVLRNEAKVLGMLQDDWFCYNLRDLGFLFVPLSHQDAEENFVNRYIELFECKKR